MENSQGRPAFNPNRQMFGEEICGAAELLSDQMEMAKELLRFHFSSEPVTLSSVLAIQDQLARFLGGPEVFVPLSQSDLEGLDKS